MSYFYYVRAVPPYNITDSEELQAFWMYSGADEFGFVQICVPTQKSRPYLSYGTPEAILAALDTIETPVVSLSVLARLTLRSPSTILRCLRAYGLSPNSEVYVDNARVLEQYKYLRGPDKERFDMALLMGRQTINIPYLQTLYNRFISKQAIKGYTVKSIREKVNPLLQPTPTQSRGEKKKPRNPNLKEVGPSVFLPWGAKDPITYVRYYSYDKAVTLGIKKDYTPEYFRACCNIERDKAYPLQVLAATSGLNYCALRKILNTYTPSEYRVSNCGSLVKKRKQVLPPPKGNFYYTTTPDGKKTKMKPVAEHTALIAVPGYMGEGIFLALTKYSKVRKAKPL